MLDLQTIRIAYGDTTVVHDVNFTVEAGEFFTLLGPSGCGKTTILRAVAGFVPVASGRILINGSDVTTTPPEDRDVGIVFQNYALFPHMSVFENVAFGLRAAGLPASNIRDRVDKILDTTGITAHAQKRPEALSGGQQQRVAIGRSMVMGARILLFDEPLSNLDAKIREAMRSEIKKLQRELGFTAVFVTHDQEEALALSDRLMVLKEGRVQQVGTGRELYRHPRNAFVCQFVGDANQISPELAAKLIASPASLEPGTSLYVRPEAISIATNAKGQGLQGLLIESYFLGRATRLEIRVGEQTISCIADSTLLSELPEPGSNLWLTAKAASIHAFASDEPT